MIALLALGFWPGTQPWPTAQAIQKPKETPEFARVYANAYCGNVRKGSKQLDAVWSALQTVKRNKTLAQELAIFTVKMPEGPPLAYQIMAYTAVTTCPDLQ